MSISIYLYIYLFIYLSISFSSIKYNFFLTVQTIAAHLNNIF